MGDTASSTSDSGTTAAAMVCWPLPSMLCDSMPWTREVYQKEQEQTAHPVAVKVELRAEPIGYQLSVPTGSIGPLAITSGLAYVSPVEP